MSPDPFRRRLDELVTRYDLEPTLREIFVEGPTDRAFFSWFVNRSGLDDLVIYEIETVDISSDVVNASELENSNRGRVIALSIHLSRHIPADLTSRVACIVDKDFDHIFPVEYSVPILVQTDYTSLEVYSMTANVLGKLLSVIWLRPPVEASRILTEIIPILRKLYSIRIAIRLLEYGLSDLTFERCCRLDGRQVLFDIEDFLTRYLSKGARLAQKPQLLERIAEIEPALPEEDRLSVRGRDFVRLLFWYLTKLKGSRGPFEIEAFTRVLLSCIEYDDVRGEGLFVEIMSRFARARTA